MIGAQQQSIEKHAGAKKTGKKKESETPRERESLSFRCSTGDG
jgi:hypothetical protein